MSSRQIGCIKFRIDYGPHGVNCSGFYRVPEQSGWTSGLRGRWRVNPGFQFPIRCLPSLKRLSGRSHPKPPSPTFSILRYLGLCQCYPALCLCYPALCFSAVGFLLVVPSLLIIDSLSIISGLPRTFAPLTHLYIIGYHSAPPTLA